jgi:hypothetical protein
VRLAAGCGIAAVEAIRSGQIIPVVFITANGQDVHRRLEDATVVAKPFTITDLSRALDAACLR